RFGSARSPLPTRAAADTVSHCYRLLRSVVFSENDGINLHIGEVQYDLLNRPLHVAALARHFQILEQCVFQRELQIGIARISGPHKGDLAHLPSVLSARSFHYLPGGMVDFLDESDPPHKRLGTLAVVGSSGLVAGERSLHTPREFMDVREPLEPLLCGIAIDAFMLPIHSHFAHSSCDGVVRPLPTNPGCRVLRETSSNPILGAEMVTGVAAVMAASSLPADCPWIFVDRVA